MWGGEAPIVATVAVVGSIRADMVANIPLGCRSNGDVSRPAAGPDGQQQLAGRYTLACIGEGLTADENRRSDSVLTSVFSTFNNSMRLLRGCLKLNTESRRSLILTASWNLLVSAYSVILVVSRRKLRSCCVMIVRKFIGSSNIPLDFICVQMRSLNYKVYEKSWYHHRQVEEFQQR
jgi:hypothetical protein